MTTSAQRLTRKFRAAQAAANTSVPPLAFQYRVVKAPDGKVEVYDVPIFGENERDFGDEVVGYDLPWLTTALAVDRQLRAGGYSAPMHFGHHEPGIERERAGVFMLLRVAARLYLGKPKSILFAKLVFDDAEKFERFRKEYVYRSVEISPEKPNEINSLALLASEAPYFRFPIAKQFTRAFRSLQGGGMAFLWRFNMGGNATTPTTPTTDAGTQNFTAGAPVQAAAAPAAPAQAAAQPAVDPVAEFMKKCDARFSKLEAALGIGGDEYAAEEGVDYAVPPAEPDGDEAAPGIKKEQKTPPIVAAAAIQAAANAENLALRARLEVLEKKDAENALTQKYSDELAPWLTTPELKREFSKCVKQGEVVVRAFATALKSVRPATSPRASETRTDETIAPPQDKPEVAKYAAVGSEKHAQARRMAAVYEAAPKGHYVRNHSLEAWLRHNVGEV